MASYTSPRGPNGTIPAGYPHHQLPAPGHAHSSYSSTQTLPSMAPSTNGHAYAAPSYGQPQSYQHHQSPYQTQQGQPPQPHPQAYQQPPPPGPPQHSQPSPTAATQSQQPSSGGPVEGTVARLEPVSTVVNGRRYAYVPIAANQPPGGARFETRPRRLAVNCCVREADCVCFSKTV